MIKPVKLKVLSTSFDRIPLISEFMSCSLFVYDVSCGCGFKMTIADYERHV